MKVIALLQRRFLCRLSDRTYFNVTLLEDGETRSKNCLLTLTVPEEGETHRI